MKPYYEHAGITIYCGDCREVMPPNLPAHVVIADPPYQETVLAWDRSIAGWLDNLPADSLWCFGSFRFFLQNEREFYGWKFAQELIWEKQNGSGAVIDRFNRVHELIVQFYRGRWDQIWHEVPKLPVANWKKSHRVKRRGSTPHRGTIGSTPWKDEGMRAVRSVIQAKNEHMSAVYPTQKPLKLLRLLVEYSCPKGGLIVDPCCGSGTALIAARQLGRNAIGIDLSESACEIAAKRLNQEVLDFGEVPA